MPVSYQVKLHDSPVIWPEMKPESEVLALRDTTIEYVWQTTYQSKLFNPKGNVVKREWFNDRFGEIGVPIGRWISFDTALSDTESSAKSAMVAGALMPDYRLKIIDVWAERVQFPQLLNIIKNFANKHNEGGLLKSVIIEGKVSGISAAQTLRQSSDEWLSQKIQLFTQRYDKETRLSQAALWCSLGCV